VTRVALLTEIPAPYRIPLFNALAQRVELRVLFLRERHPDRQYDLHRNELHFDWQVVPGFDVMLHNRWIVLSRSIGRLLRDADAVVLGGWNQPAFLQALAWCRVRHVPTILWSESTRRDLRSGRHERAKRLLLRMPDAFVVPGRASHEYLESLGVPPARIVDAPNAVDAEIFGTVTRTRSDGPVRLIVVGRLAPEKGIDTLLGAADGLPVEIVLAGAGAEAARLRRLAGPNVTFLGHVERDALPALYANADVAVMPSRSEPWGMALNEAALSGLPLVSTTAAGAAWDLIEDGANGFRVPPDDVDAMRTALRRLVDSPELRARFGQRSLELAQRFTPDAWAEATAALAERIAG
jgi:glycosyltransferase involved in cell wall biosynthesis